MFHSSVRENMQRLGRLVSLNEGDHIWIYSIWLSYQIIQNNVNLEAVTCDLSIKMLHYGVFEGNLAKLFANVPLM